MTKKPIERCLHPVCSPLDEVFPFEYQGGGYFRRKGVLKGVAAEILHGHQAIEWLYAEMTKDPAMEANAELTP
jgi:hypothetical protein